MKDERLLLQRVQNHDAEAVGELYDHYAPLVYAYLHRRLQDAHLAEDLTSETFIRVLRAVQDERFWHTSFRAWLYRIAHNLVVDHYRHQSRTPEVPLDEYRVVGEASPDKAFDEKSLRTQLHNAIQRLTSNQQQVMVLRFGERLTAKETAEVMGKNVGAIEALQHRALKTLRTLLRKDE